MNGEDRKLLTRLDERSLNIWRVTEEQDRKIDLILEGQKAQNGSILRNTLWRKVITGIGGVSVVIIITWLLKLTFS